MDQQHVSVTESPDFPIKCACIPNSVTLTFYLFKQEIIHLQECDYKMKESFLHYQQHQTQVKSDFNHQSHIDNIISISTMIFRILLSWNQNLGLAIYILPQKSPLYNNPFLVARYSTLQPALSVRPSVRPSVTTLFWFLRSLASLLLPK